MSQAERLGKVFLIGAGPGAPDLITVKGLRCLQQSDVIVYDALIDPALLSYAPNAEKVYVGKKAGGHGVAQDIINALLIGYAREGRTTARLKGGDPFVFGRGGEEALALAEQGIPFEVVPGVTAGVATLAYAGIPTTHRGTASGCVFLTGHPWQPNVECVRKAAQLWTDMTLIFYMGLSSLEQIVTELLDCGCPESLPIAVIESGTRPEQRVTISCLADIVARAKEEHCQSPAIIVVGKTVMLHERLAWFRHETQ